MVLNKSAVIFLNSFADITIASPNTKMSIIYNYLIERNIYETMLNYLEYNNGLIAIMVEMIETVFAIIITKVRNLSNIGYYR